MGMRPASGKKKAVCRLARNQNYSVAIDIVVAKA
jgi:hypothetical protein